MTNVIPFWPRRTEADVGDVALAIFAALAASNSIDAAKAIAGFRKCRPEFRDVDIRLGFALAHKAMCGLERIVLDHADGDAG